MSKNFSYRLLIPLDVYQAYQKIVDNKAKKDAFVARLRQSFKDILSESVRSIGGDETAQKPKNESSITTNQTQDDPKLIVKNLLPEEKPHEASPAPSTPEKTKEDDPLDWLGLSDLIGGNDS